MHCGGALPWSFGAAPGTVESGAITMVVILTMKSAIANAEKNRFISLPPSKLRRSFNDENKGGRVYKNSRREKSDL
jgi:hypothetical protein